MIRRPQTTADVIVPITLVGNTGGNYSGELQANFRVWVYDPTGALVAGFSGMVPDGSTVAVTEIGTTGIYLVRFPQAAATKAFTATDGANPYLVVIDSLATGIDPIMAEVWIGTPPAKAGDAMTLTAAYNPAKTAAQQADLLGLSGYCDTYLAKYDQLLAVYTAVQAFPAQVWDEAAASHAVAGSFGNAVSAIRAQTDQLAFSTSGTPSRSFVDALAFAPLDPDTYVNLPLAATISAEVWDVPAADHVAAGSFGYYLKRIFGWLFWKKDVTTTQIKTYDSDSTTVLGTQTVSGDGTTNSSVSKAV